MLDEYYLDQATLDKSPVYYTSAHIGDVIDCSALVEAYERLEWTEVIPSVNQDIEIKIRSSPDNSAWTDWKIIYSSPCTNFATIVQRYLEWRATLTTSDIDTIPKLQDFYFKWRKRAA